jgi:putative hydrolase of the HAD superfamily
MIAARAVIFDLFHTLTAREADWSDLPPTCEVLGIDRLTWDRALTESSRWRLAGEERDPQRILHRLVREVDPTITEETIQRAIGVRMQRFGQVFQRIPPRNVETLKRLRAAGFKLALLSNADAMEVSCYSSGILAGLFDVEIFSCDAGCVKPEPEIFHHCLAQLALPAADCVFVGDGGSDELQGASALGIRTIFASGILEDIWPERIAARRAVADHHVRWIPEILPLLGVPCPEELTPA